MAKRWFPILRSEEAEKGHVAQVALLGKEFAVWRAGDGQINVWENRCPHRGVRLSLGTNTGTELKCRYHCWRFESGSGQCVSIPSIPQRPIAKAIKVATYRCAEKYGYVWVNLEIDTDLPMVSALEDRPLTTLRSLFTNASLATVIESLSAYCFLPENASNLEEALLPAKLSKLEPLTFEAKSKDTAIIFLLQPASEESTVIHAAVTAALTGIKRLTTLRHHNERMEVLRDLAESSASRLKTPHFEPAQQIRGN